MREKISFEDKQAAVDIYNPIDPNEVFKAVDANEIKDKFNGLIDDYEGNILYTNPLPTPLNFGYIPAGTTFNNVTLREIIHRALYGSGSTTVTITVTPTPNTATVFIDGVQRTSAGLISGSSVLIQVTAPGYSAYSQTIIVPNVDTNYPVNLSSASTFDYFIGEIGNIFAADPSGITQARWDSDIKYNGTSQNMDRVQGAISLPQSFNKDSTGSPLQWWIILVPTAKTTMVASLSDYHWETWEELTTSWSQYTDTIYSGVVTLDSVSYTYRAIRPANASKIKFTK